MAIGRLGSVAGPLAAGQILAAGAGTTGVLLATSPGLVIAALSILTVIARTGATTESQPQAAN
ncbi:putative 3-hydroxyphenylpropionic transporter MhpT [compost metagenome]